jgi:hypothetical protein
VRQPLNEHVERVYFPFLRELGAKHIQYSPDADHYAEVDRYANEELGIEFIRDRDGEYIRICPLNRTDDFFALSYLVEMLGIPAQNDMNFDCIRELVQLKENVYNLFRSKYYRCFRAAYSRYENCRNLIDIKGAGWD